MNILTFSFSEQFSTVFVLIFVSTLLKIKIAKGCFHSDEIEDFRFPKEHFREQFLEEYIFLLSVNNIKKNRKNLFPL